MSEPRERDRNQERVLLTGATGFVGQRLYPHLIKEFGEVICASRIIERATKNFPERVWRHLDVDDTKTLGPALKGVDIAYYLIHEMAEEGDFEEREREAALRFRLIAEKAGVKRIVYLGGVEPSGTASKHLRSRMRTGEILRSGTLSCVELRAGMIIGEGSASWQMVRDLSARLPVMILPRWIKCRSQPVSIRDVLKALVKAAKISDEEAGCYSIPGGETLSAKEILLRVSRLRGYKPITFDVPFVSPRLSSYWIRWVTRTNQQIASQLVEGMRSDLLAAKPPFWDFMPGYELESFDHAARHAMQEGRASLSLSAVALEAVVQQVARKND